MKRKHIPLKEKWAATLYEMEYWRRRAEVAEAALDRLPIPSLRQQMADILHFRNTRAPSAKVISLYDYHHIVFHAINGADVWMNLTPMPRAEHREKTRADLATIAKGKRIQRKQAEHQTRMEAKHADISDPTSDRAAKKRFASNRQGAARSRWRTARRG